MLHFYTIWTLIFWLVGLYFIISMNGRKTNYSDRIGNVFLIMLSFVAICGSFLTYIYPRVVCTASLYRKKCFGGDVPLILDIIMHQSPLCIHLALLFFGFWNIKKRFLLEDILITLLMLLIYLFFKNPWEVYISVEAIKLRNKVDQRIES